MSWINKRTGRPKEQGGHRTIHVSVSNRIFNILEISDNYSKYIENCVAAYTDTKWIAFHESNVTANDNCSVFKTALTDVWLPNDNMRNGVVSTLCTFDYRCTGRAFFFRLKINESLTLPTEVPATATWSSSNVFVDSNFNSEKIRQNRDSYIIEFKFEPLGMLDQAYVKDISVFLEVVDGLLTSRT